MVARRQLPERFLRELEALESSYLSDDDPIRQSGFGGGPERWRSEREPILEAIEGNGDILDIGCANGYLLECLMIWGRERGLLWGRSEFTANRSSETAVTGVRVQLRCRERLGSGASTASPVCLHPVRLRSPELSVRVLASTS